MLQRGHVADPANTGADVEAIRVFNEAAIADDRVDTVLLTIGDGVSILQKR